MKCAYCKLWIKKHEQHTEKTAYNPKVKKYYHPECARKDTKRANSQFTIHLGTWNGSNFDF